MNAHFDIDTFRARVMRNNGGFLHPSDLAALVLDSAGRLEPILIRCGMCRMTTPAQNVAYIMRMVEASGDYVRDLSLPVSRDGNPQV